MSCSGADGSLLPAPGGYLLVELRRGSIVESRHRVHVAVVDGEGRLVARAGDPDLITFWRSAAKPFQAMPLVSDGAADRFGLTREELALCCASHSSEPGQVALVRDFLGKIGCSERDLRCGPHAPLSPAVAKDYETRGVRVTAVYSNCSGKHTGMLALARHHGWPVEDYTDPAHPVQRRCLEEVGRWTGLPASHIGIGVDGCGVPCFALGLRSAALAYARLANAERGTRNAEPTPGSPFRVPTSAFRVVEAMLRHPELVAGEGRACTDVMRAHPGRVIVKVGAEGVYSGLLVREGWGIALKVEDGHTGAAELAVAAVLSGLGLRPQPAHLERRPVTNSRGETVGELRVSGGVVRESGTGEGPGT
jgi:L-asparaginase II